MAASIEGVFRIIDRASGPMRRMQRQAQMTDAAIQRLGRDLDTLGNRNQIRNLENTERSLRAVRTEADRTQTVFSRTNVETTRLGRSMVSGSRDSDTFSRSIRGASRETEGFLHRLIKVGASIASVGKIMGVLKLPAMGAGIGFAVQAVANLAGGLTTLLPMITDLGGAAAALPAVFTGLGLGMVAVKLATHDLSKAMAGNKRALAGLTPEAKRFITTLKEYKPVMKELRQSAQQGLFPGLDLALRRLQRGVPMARRLIGGAGRQVGSQAAATAEMLTTPGRLAMISRIGTQGIWVIGRLGAAFRALLDAVLNIADAARPFTRWLINSVVNFAKFIDHTVKAKRATGEMATYFMRVRHSLETFGHIFRDLFFTLRNIGRAARGTGEGLWRSAERAVAGWRKFTDSIGGRITLVRYFQQTKDLLGSVMGLIGDLGKAVFRMGQQPGMSSIVERLRDAVPALERLLNTFVTTYAPVLANLIVEVLRAFRLVVAFTGKLNILLAAAGKVLGFFNNLVDRVPALQGALMAIFTTLSIGLFTRRVLNAGRAMLGLAGATRQAVVAQEQLNVVETGGAAAGAAAGAGRAGMLAGLFGVRGASGTRVGRGLGRLGGRLTASGTVGESLALRGMMLGGRVAGIAGRIGRVASPVGIGALVASTALSFAPDRFVGGQKGKGILGSVATGAGVGALAGTLGIPGIGTGIGAAVGAAAGLAIGLRRAFGGVRDTVGETFKEVRREMGALGGDQPTLRQLRQQVARLDHLQSIYARHTDENSKKIRAGLLQELRARRTVEVQIEKQRRAERNARSVEVARRLLPQFGREFNMLRGKVGTERAMTMTTEDIISRMNKLPEAGRAIIARNALIWAHEAARQNPKLAGQFEKLKDSVLASFKKTHDGVRLWNDKILLGTQDQWKTIATEMQRPVEHAKEAITRQFTMIQQQAIQALMAMGYSRTQASMTVRNMEEGMSASAAKQTAAGDVHHHGLATGGRIPGRGLRDTVPVGGMAAPGELVVNRHTERRIKNLLGGRTTLGREFGREGRSHSQPLPGVANTGGFAYGGRGGAGGLSLSVVRPAIRAVAHEVLGAFPGLSITSTLGGRHAQGSYHYQGMAVDLGGSPTLMNAAARLIQARLAGQLLEGIHNPGLSVKNGQVVPGSFWGATTWGAHRNHIHLAAGAGGGATGDFLGGAAMQAVGPLGVYALPIGGVAGALSLGVGRAMARGMRRRLNATLAGRGGLGAFTGATGGSGGANAALAHRMMLAAGWPEGEWGPLHSLWMRESGFSATARNKSSGAFGIPQSLPATKMGPAAVAGNPAAQISWGLNYIRGRYGTPAAAWAHELAQGWYGQGGRVPFAGWHQHGGTFTARRPTLFGAGDGPRPERVHIGPLDSTTGRPVVIEQMHITNNRPGDIRRQVRDEVAQAFDDLESAVRSIPMEREEHVT